MVHPFQPGTSYVDITGGAECGQDDCPCHLPADVAETTWGDVVPFFTTTVTYATQLFSY